jgi:hypothetical protein
MLVRARMVLRGVYEWMDGWMTMLGPCRLLICSRLGLAVCYTAAYTI